MAIAKHDGSIVLSTAVDQTGVKKGMTEMKRGVSQMSGQFARLGGVIAAAFSIRAIVSFAKESKELYRIQMQNEVKLATVMRQRMNATDKQIQSIFDLASAEQKLGIIGDEVQLAGLQQLATFAKTSDTLKTLLPAMNNLIAQQKGYDAATGDAVNVANLMGKVLQGQVSALTRVGITFSEAEEKVLKYGSESERAAMLAKVITANVGEMNAALAKTDAGRQKQLANTLGDINEQFGNAVEQISILFLPALQRVASVLAKIADFARDAAQAIAELFGKKPSGNEWKNIESGSGKAAENIGDAADGMSDLASETEKAGKAAKKSLAAFDELNILKSGDSGAADAAAFDISGGSSGLPEAGEQDLDPKKKAEEAAEALLYLLGVVGTALAAVGLLLLFSGNIGWGVGCLIAGITAFGVAKEDGEGFDLEKIKSDIESFSDVIAGALAAIGVLLLFTGNVPWGVGLIVAGAAVYGAKKENVGDGSEDEKAITKLAKIMEYVSVALVAVGILLVFAGMLPLGIGFIVLGKEAFGAAEEQLNKDGATTEISEFLKSNQDLIVGVALAILVVALLMLAAGIINPFTLGLLAAGAGGLAVEEQATGKSVVELVTEFLKNNTAIIVGVSLAMLVIAIVMLVCGMVSPLSIGLLIAVLSAALLVLGIILCVTGVGLPLGIALIAAGAAGLVTVTALNWNYIVDKVKEVWGKIKSFWDTHIKKVFTKEFWADLGKNAVNGFIGVLEKGLNFIIGKINDFIGGIDKVVSSVGDFIGIDLNIPKIPEVKIPRLARGAVIPPNREFLAVLGDQKRGTNIEAPLETIEEAVERVLDRRGQESGGEPIILQLDGREVGRVFGKAIRDEAKRTGTSLVSGKLILG